MDTTSDRNAKVENFLSQLQGIIRVSISQSLQDSRKFRLVTTDEAQAKAAGRYLVCRSEALVHFGSTAARLLVGMGAGRSKLIEVVSLEDPATRDVLLKYTGWGGAAGGFGSQILGKMRSDAFEIAKYFSNLVPTPQSPLVAAVPSQAQVASLLQPSTASVPAPSPTPAKPTGATLPEGVSANSVLLIKGLKASKQAGHAGQGVWTLTGMIVNPTGGAATQASLMATFLDETGGEILRDQQVFPLSPTAQESAFAWKVNAVPQTASKVKVRVVGATWAGGAGR